jgi:hypothetical protein
MTWENALPLLPGGQVVAGSNPVSPTQGRGGLVGNDRIYARSFRVQLWELTRSGQS